MFVFPEVEKSAKEERTLCRGSHSWVVPLYFVWSINVCSKSQWVWRGWVVAPCLFGIRKDLNLIVSPECGCSLFPGRAGEGFAASAGLTWW